MHWEEIELGSRIGIVLFRFSLFVLLVLIVILFKKRQKIPAIILTSHGCLLLGFMLVLGLVPGSWEIETFAWFFYPYFLTTCLIPLSLFWGVRVLIKLKQEAQ